MTNAFAQRLVAQAERLGIKAHVQAHGRGKQIRFTGDAWHKDAAWAAIALLYEIPTPVSR